MFQNSGAFWQIHEMVSTGGKVKKKIDIEEEWKKQQAEERANGETCPICNAKESVKFNRSNDICIKCGSEIDTNLTFGQEWRYYGASDSKSSNPTRVGMPTNKLLPGSSMGSTISKNYTSSLAMNRVKQKQKWIGMDYRSRSLLEIFGTMTAAARRAGLTNKIIEKAKVYYKCISETKISRGKNRVALEAACLFQSCKVHNVPRSIKEIAELYNIDTRNMTKGYKKFRDIIKLSKDNINKSGSAKTTYIQAATPLDYIDRFCCNLNMTDKMKQRCKHAAMKTHELNIADENTPTSITAGSIFLISMVYNLGITKKQISQASGGVSEVTISKCFKKLYPHRELLIIS
jgi:transcription initiation factor TFIIB